MPQAVVNIGMVGHVDHGKTTLVEALSGIWTDTHSEEIKRGITIRLGYADTSFRKCLSCGRYGTKEKCPYCGGETELSRKVSFVDAPGHEALMATTLCGAAIMDGAVLVIAANEPCPQPQTKEHLAALDIAGVHRVVVAQNKIELVPKEKILEHYQQIRRFLSGTFASEAPVVPISAIHKVNLDVLIEEIEKNIPTPTRDLSKPPLMYVARSFDTNKPGTRPEELVGGVVGGMLSQGRLKVGDEIEIRPGIQEGGSCLPLRSKVASIQAGKEKLEEAVPGGLIGISTLLDPSLTKADRLVGCVVGVEGSMPPVLSSLELEVHLMERVVGLPEELEVKPLTQGEQLVVNVGTATTVGTVMRMKGERVELKLTRLVCASPGARVALSRRVGGRWRLIGYGILPL
ncbi:MAG: translation initiation factor IF-2 subunit gamma [Candidatus Hadarchaeales archaeon]